MQNLTSEDGLHALVANEQAARAQELCSKQAYVSLLTLHEKSVTGWKTFIAGQQDKFDTQVKLLRVLLRSLRAQERVSCRRDFVLMLGTSVRLPAESERALQLDGMNIFQV
jgi:hypothetical protein